MEELGCVRRTGNPRPQDSPHRPPLQTQLHNRPHTHRNPKQIQSKEHLGHLLPQLPSQSPQTSVFPATLTQPLPIERRHLEALLLQVELSGVAPAPRKRHDAPQWPCRRPPSLALARDNALVFRRLTGRGAGAVTRRGGD